MKVGIVGMPNAGKSSLFNALTKAGAEAANYPFTTIEPNVAVVPVVDERLEQVAAPSSARRRSSGTRSPSTTSPGSSPARSKGEGLGNQFLANIRETDAIVHVVRAHTDPNVIHSEGSVDPCARHRDDRDRADLRRPRAGRAPPRARRARGARRRQAAVAEEAWLREVIEALHAGRPARTVPGPDEAPDARAPAAAADRQAGAVRRQRRRGQRRGPAARRRARRKPRGASRSRSPARGWRPSSRELDDEDAAAMRADLGVSESGLQRVVARRVRAARPAGLLHGRRGQARAVAGTCAAGSARGTPRARSTATSRRASSAPRSSAGTSSSTPAATPARAIAARCGSRAATT